MTATRRRKSWAEKVEVELKAEDRRLAKVQAEDRRLIKVQRDLKRDETGRVA